MPIIVKRCYTPYFGVCLPVCMPGRLSRTRLLYRNDETENFYVHIITTFVNVKLTKKT